MLSLGFLYSQLFITPSYPTRSFTGETVIVTGSNVGLGYEAARHFVRLEELKRPIHIKFSSRSLAQSHKGPEMV